MLASPIRVKYLAGLGEIIGEILERCLKDQKRADS